MILELLVFVYLLLCFLYFFGVIKKFKGSNSVFGEIKGMLVCNVISIFFAYGLLLSINYFVYSYGHDYFFIFRLFFNLSINLDSQEYALLLIKCFYLFIGCVSLHCIGKYFIRNRIAFQYFTLAALGVWAGLFVMNLDNLFYALLLMDAISLVTISLVGLSATPGFMSALSFSLHYYLFSIFSSLVGYAGCFLLYTNFKTLNVNAIVYMGTLESM